MSIGQGENTNQHKTPQVHRRMKKRAPIWFIFCANTVIFQTASINFKGWF